MEHSPEISIITVNYNGIQETRELIRSLQHHIHSCTYEIIVVDNGSDLNEAIPLNEEYPDVRVIRSGHNLGFAGGNNLGIMAARGRYILLLNNDTYIEDDTLHYLKSRLATQPQIAAAGPKIRFAYSPRRIQFAGFTPMSKFTLRNKAIGYGEADRGQYDQPQQTPFLHGAAMMIKREAIEKTGLMPEIYFLYYEEMDWCEQMQQAGYELWYEPACTVFHKESRTTGNQSPLKTYYLTRNRLLYAWRNRHGLALFLAILYQLIIVIPKNIIVNLLKGKISPVRAILKGCVDFILLKNKRK